MHRTHLGNLQQSGPLLPGESSRELQGPLHTIEVSFFRLAFGAVGGMDPGVSEPNGHLLERPGLSSRVHATVIDAQLPSAASKKSYGVGPVSVPPFDIGSCATRRCERAEISWAKPSPEPRTSTSVS